VIVSVPSLVTLLTDTAELAVTVIPLPAMQTLSLLPGTVPPLQFAGVAQSPEPAAVHCFVPAAQARAPTVRLALAVRVNDPLVPVTVKDVVPSGVVVLVVRVRAEVPGVAGFGENAQVAPAGSPLHVRFTGSEKPAPAVMFTV
jgi:hypothetical protein